MRLRTRRRPSSRVLAASHVQGPLVLSLSSPRLMRRWTRYIKIESKRKATEGDGCAGRAKKDGTRKEPEDDVERMLKMWKTAFDLERGS